MQMSKGKNVVKIKKFLFNCSRRILLEPLRMNNTKTGVSKNQFTKKIEKKKKKKMVTYFL